MGNYTEDEINWLVDWKTDQESGSKRFWRESGYSYNDVCTYADAVQEFKEKIESLSITAFYGGEKLCKQTII